MGRGRRNPIFVRAPGRSTLREFAWRFHAGCNSIFISRRANPKVPKLRSTTEIRAPLHKRRVVLSFTTARRRPRPPRRRRAGTPARDISAKFRLLNRLNVSVRPFANPRIGIARSVMATKLPFVAFHDVRCKSFGLTGSKAILRQTTQFSFLPRI